MSLTLAVPDHLADRLRALATERGVAVEALGEEALAVGLAGLTSSATDDSVAIDIAVPAAHQRSAVVSMRSPIIVNGPVRPLHVTFELGPEAAAYAG